MKGLFWYQLNEIGLKPGCSIFLRGVNVTKTHQIEALNFLGLWRRKLHGIQPKEAWFILTNLGSLKAAITAYRGKARKISGTFFVGCIGNITDLFCFKVPLIFYRQIGYKQRFDIEQMFKDFKSGGYNLEETNVSNDRLISLILIIAFAYTLATLNGQKLKKKGVQKYIGRVKEYGRLVRRLFSFYIGLYSQDWVNCINPCWELVMEFMRLNRNKLSDYLRGLRAMKLILSVS